ncbi:hypothetical protein ACSXCN_04730 [Clostridium perfringens]
MKKDNILSLIFILIMISSILCCVALVTLKYFAQGYFREWIEIMVALIGALIGGVITMIGVVVTINRSFDIELRKEEKAKKCEEEKIANLALIAYSEIKSYLESVKDYNVNIIKLKLDNSSIDETEFWNIVNESDWRNDIYFVSSDIKKYFYNIVSKNYNEDIISKFIKFYTNHERIRRLQSLNNKINSAFIDDMNLYCLDQKFIEFKNDILKNINKDKFNEFLKNENLGYYNYNKGKSELELDCYESSIIDFRIFNEDITDLLKYLNDSFNGRI